ERFIGILIEHYAGAFPLWLSPVQATVLPVADRHNEYAAAVTAEMRAAGLRVEPDLRTESVGKKIAEAEHQRIPCILVVGDKEVEAGTVSLRRRDQGNLGARSLAELTAELVVEAASRRA
ncbi:MAG TPA: His/Gly/Thr/Pro-type tRNA ligase C-terminal domain-containing protein, partial [Gaiellales bacterium]